MEKDIGKIPKNPETEIIIRIDDFGGKRGLTIREFVTSERYTGFTKAGVRITSENFEKFRELINSISPAELISDSPAQEKLPETNEKQKQISTSEDISDIPEEDLM